MNICFSMYLKFVVIFFTGFLNNSFNIDNFWLALPQLTNSSTISWTFVLYLTLGFLQPLRQFDEISDDKCNTLLSLDTTEEWTWTWLVLWILSWGEHIIIFIGVFLFLSVSFYQISLSTRYGTVMSWTRTTVTVVICYVTCGYYLINTSNCYMRNIDLRVFDMFVSRYLDPCYLWYLKYSNDINFYIGFLLVPRFNRYMKYQRYWKEKYIFYPFRQDKRRNILFSTYSTFYSNILVNNICTIYIIITSLLKIIIIAMVNIIQWSNIYYNIDELYHVYNIASITHIHNNAYAIPYY